MGFFPTTHAVFGAMGDKDLAPMLAKMGPLVDAWYFTDLPTPRAAAAADLLARWQQQPGRREVPASTHASPEAALRAAVAAAEPTDRILVFGSFYTVGGVLTHGVPRLSAKHLG
jgi:dihydrofolate synthase/folylpolyglutamate synthase